MQRRRLHALFYQHRHRYALKEKCSLHDRRVNWGNEGVCFVGRPCAASILVEAASRYSRPFKAVKSEDASIPEAVRVKAGKRASRLKKRRAALRKRGLSPSKAKVAVARELAERIYRIAVLPVQAEMLPAGKPAST